MSSRERRLLDKDIEIRKLQGELKHYKTCFFSCVFDLDRTRKALDVAVDALTRCQKNTPANYTATQAVFLLAKNSVFIDKALEQITALEQKDVK